MSQKQLTYLTVEDVLALHEDAVAAFGGGSGVRGHSIVENATKRPKASFGGHEKFPDVPSKAAALFHGLISGHPFVDGNKRAATASALVFLRLNGFTPDVSDEHLEELVFDAASGEYSVEELTEWFGELVNRN
jgi:death-on-curing protein